jgi:hypothetical protein
MTRTKIPASLQSLFPLSKVGILYSRLNSDFIHTLVPSTSTILLLGLGTVEAIPYSYPSLYFPLLPPPRPIGSVCLRTPTHLRWV